MLLFYVDLAPTSTDPSQFVVEIEFDSKRLDLRSCLHKGNCQPSVLQIALELVKKVREKLKLEPAYFCSLLLKSSGEDLTFELCIRCAGSQKTLFAVSKCVLEQEIEQLRTPWVTAESSWPVPSGELFLQLSHVSFAKVLISFAQSFVSKNVLSQNSWILSPPTFETRFKLFERPIPPPFEDSENNRVQELTIWNGNRVCSLITDGGDAELLGVNPTGHLRRSPLHLESGVAFWRLEVEPLMSSPSMGSGPQNGLFIQDLEVVDVDLTRLEGLVYVQTSALLFSGVQGDSISPFFWRVDLLNLLRRVELGSEYCVTAVPSFFEKDYCLTEVRCPRAFVHSIHVPGQVPKQQYWG